MEVIVSVICNVYNHEKYIRNCLDGLVMQKTSFTYEILVHDDASTDSSASIIREYEREYPDIIKPIYQVENQYTKGGVGRFQYPRVRGKYIAICEGDDYWTNPNKLQIQVDELERHPEIDICAHAATIISATSGKTIGFIAPRNSDSIISTEDVIMGEGGFVSTNSLVYRSYLNSCIPEFRKQFKYDYALQIHGALRGGLLYLNKNMSVYRRNTPGSWTMRQANSVAKQLRFHEEKQKMLQSLDSETCQKYHGIIYKRMKLNNFNIAMATRDYKTILSKEYSDCLKMLDMKDRLKIYILFVFPFLSGLKGRLINVATKIDKKQN